MKGILQDISYQKWGQFNFGINGQFRNWNCLFKKNMELINLELKFATKN